MKEKKKKKYKGTTPPCGIDCNGCPRFGKEKNGCEGADKGCKHCKTIYQCNEKKGIDYCYQCSKFPCSRFKKFSKTWEKYGQNLIENQKELKMKAKGKSEES